MRESVLAGDPIGAVRDLGIAQLPNNNISRFLSIFDGFHFVLIYIPKSVRAAEERAAGGKLSRADAIFSGPLRAKAAERHRPTYLLHLGDAVFPAVARFADHIVGAARRERSRRALEPYTDASPEAHCRRRAQRNTDDVLEGRPILVPPDAGARIIADEQSWTRSSARRPANTAARSWIGSSQSGMGSPRCNRPASKS